VCCYYSEKLVSGYTPVSGYTFSESRCDIFTLLSLVSALLSTLGENMQPLVNADHLLKGNVNSTEHWGGGGHSKVINNLASPLRLVPVTACTKSTSTVMLGSNSG
jgi:hypothetical protein